MGKLRKKAPPACSGPVEAMGLHRPMKFRWGFFYESTAQERNGLKSLLHNSIQSCYLMQCYFSSKAQAQAKPKALKNSGELRLVTSLVFGPILFLPLFVAVILFLRIVMPQPRLG